MSWGWILTGFGLGTFKFLFAHWGVYGAAISSSYEIGFWEIFLSCTAGAWFSMTIFFFSSGILMRKAKLKRLNAIIEAEKNGKPFKKKKVFTRMNKTIVWIKRNIGIYGVTFLSPLFLSIPIGSIVCAKFYGSRRRTFPLMMIFTATYSLLMCLWIFGV